MMNTCSAWGSPLTINNHDESSEVGVRVQRLKFLAQFAEFQDMLTKDFTSGGPISRCLVGLPILKGFV